MVGVTNFFSLELTTTQNLDRLNYWEHVDDGCFEVLDNHMQNTFHAFILSISKFRSQIKVLI